ncbi:MULTISPECIES: Spy/CpxP family protein refolding chaperone [unclassified Bradyrhizobium]|uniref:Spy/CpxP family protein refolding chaperone n=1 Tax=unclassified Bradyrhizobium TaxID=2631580 RepID=UPI0020B2D64F|nr:MULTISPECIES: periplasmic heavy metal sensor [unclassified Bradyrhizobium]MCP3401377.1 periplasmic heavy metal sensor [Bradyrhizobium sp. CCGB20]MCP3409879.1 periplasmic heavy metal sensor [Bradyrhizobium sp. CCGB01]
MRRILLLAAALVVTCNTANAQSSQPYAGLEQRPIKALSRQQINDLQTGRGMGLALAAELNGYPGPSHVLELGDRLDLTVDQRVQVQRLFDDMKQEAVPLGNKLVEQERELDHLFSARVVTSESLKTAIVAISETQAKLRESHLKYHLSTAALLDQRQMQRYAELRGYQRADDPEGHKHHH